jgi:serine/threonine protein kinase
VKERQVLGEKYVVIRKLGSGPTGTLHEGENLLLGNRVAIKMIDPALARRPGVADRVLGKAREAANLDHPNIASLLDLGEFEGTPYIVTEPLGGHSLQREIDASARPSVMLACDLILQLLSALDYAHASGVVHGALHPNNVLISYPRPGVPWVKVTDFGLFQALEDVHGDGPHPAPAGGFRAPEYATSGDIDQRADVYSAAALLHALLHGVAPGTEAETSSRVPPELTRVLADALRANPRERTPSAQSLANRLAPFAQESSRPAEIRLSSPPSIRWINNAPAAAAALPFAGVLARAVPDTAADTPRRLVPRDVAITESLLRNPRFPSQRGSPWLKRWRSMRSTLAAHPNMGAAWLFALASVGAGIACALLAAWMQ